MKINKLKYSLSVLALATSLSLTSCSSNDDINSERLYKLELSNQEKLTDEEYISQIEAIISDDFYKSIGIDDKNIDIKELAEKYPELTVDEIISYCAKIIEKSDSSLKRITLFCHVAGAEYDSIANIINTICSKPELEYLRIEFNRESNYEFDITPISNLTNLQYLLIKNIQFTDITPISNLTNLSYLGLDNNNITDISPLANLTNLTDLSLEHNNITDISPLANLTNLTELDLSGNNITNIQPLSNSTKLRFLCLDNNNITDITPISNLTNLSYLNLNTNNITDISPLANLTNLTDLSLVNNNITDINPLENLTNLADLSLYNNEITNISSLANLTNLTDLKLYNIEFLDSTIEKTVIDGLPTFEVMLEKRIPSDYHQIPKCKKIIKESD